MCVESAFDTFRGPSQRIAEGGAENQHPCASVMFLGGPRQEEVIFHYAQAA